MAGGEFVQLDRVGIFAGDRTVPEHEDFIAFDRLGVHNRQGGAGGVGGQDAVHHAGHLRLRQFQAGLADLQDRSVDRLANGAGGLVRVQRGEHRLGDQLLVVELGLAAVDRGQVFAVDVVQQRLGRDDVVTGDKARRQVRQVGLEPWRGAEHEYLEDLAFGKGFVEGDFDTHMFEVGVQCSGHGIPHDRRGQALDFADGADELAFGT
ncbi:hypothetical protein PS684_05716 [Pseudomonas fluorescens]|nr:hypothetical protein PS684_05716 [Pseudomonas fluorescens]